MSEQVFRFDTWNACRGYAGARLWWLIEADPIQQLPAKPLRACGPCRRHVSGVSQSRGGDCGVVGGGGGGGGGGGDGGRGGDGGGGEFTRRTGAVAFCVAWMIISVVTFFDVGGLLLDGLAIWSKGSVKLSNPELAHENIRGERGRSPILTCLTRQKLEIMIGLGLGDALRFRGTTVPIRHRDGKARAPNEGGSAAVGDTEPAT